MLSSSLVVLPPSSHPCRRRPPRVLRPSSLSSRHCTRAHCPPPLLLSSRRRLRTRLRHCHPWSSLPLLSPLPSSHPPDRQPTQAPPPSLLPSRHWTRARRLPPLLLSSQRWTRARRPPRLLLSSRRWTRARHRRRHHPLSSLPSSPPPSSHSPGCQPTQAPPPSSLSSRRWTRARRPPPSLLLSRCRYFPPCWHRS